MRPKHWIIVVTAAFTAVMVPVAGMAMAFNYAFGFMNQANASAGSIAPSQVALLDIPSAMLALYQGPAAHGECPGLKWSVLAAIGKVESNHNRSILPGVHSGTNYAGAAGPMQFELATWATNGVDGNGDGVKDVYSSADAIPSAAHYLCSNGGGNPATLDNAIYGYNHAQWYIHGGEGTPYPGAGQPDYCFVLCWAGRYESAQAALTSGGGTLHWPTQLAGSSVSSCYGPRLLNGVLDFHPGVDIAQAPGSPVYALATGMVTFAGPASGYGNNYVDVTFGSMITGYGHMNGMSVVVGQQVTAGQQIGVIGSQGLSFGPHLHVNRIDTSKPHNIYNSNVDPLTNGLKIPAGVPNPNGCS